MKQILESEDARESDIKSLESILVNLCPGQDSLVSEFIQAFEIREFQLGEELLDNSILASPKKYVHDEQNGSGCYIICQGRVRLLSVDKDAQREVPTSLLEVGEICGIDELFCEQPLGYRAIAASTVVVAFLPLSQLQPWLEKLSSLPEHLRKNTYARQTLIFFKTCTDLRQRARERKQAPESSKSSSRQSLLSSHALKELLPYLEEIKIAAGSPLSDATSADVGHFWLRSGEIESTKEESQTPPSIGESWGHPEEIPSNWIAKTDLWVYKLSVEHWESAQGIVPVLADSSSQSGTPSKAINQGKRRRPVTPTVVVNQPKSRKEQQQENLDSKLKTESKPIAFAKPKKKSYRRPWFAKSYPFIQQQSTSDCGPTCLTMIGQYWGKRLSINLLRNLCGVGRAGASLKSLAVAAEKVGFQARPVRASLNRLVDQKQPWIAHWEGNHYVVVYRIKGNRVILSDPAIGRRKIKLSEFKQGWTGYALLLTPTPVLRQVASAKPSLWRFWGAFLPYRSMLWPIITASVLLQLFGLITPLFTQIIFDQVLVHKSLSTLNVFIIGSLVFSIWRMALVGIRQYMLVNFSNRVDLTLVSGFVSHALSLPLQFFGSRHVGDIITRIQENRKVQAFLTRQAIGAWLDVLTAVVYVILMAYYNWNLTILVLSLLLPIVIMTVVASPLLRQVSREIFNAAAKQNSSLVEMLTGVATVKGVAAEQELRWLWEDDLTNMVNARFRGQKLSIGLKFLSSLINSLGSTALLWYGSSLVIQDQLSIGQLVAFNMLIGNVIGPVLSLVGLWDQLQEVMVSVERLEDVFSAEPEETPEKSMLVMPPLKGEVQFEDVTFRYNEDDQRNILQNISFTVYPGQTIAVVGRSGSGKSTLVNLLQGLYHPTKGRVLVDGHDICHVSPQSLRRQFGVVPQECYLFSGTILDNITLYRGEYNLEEVIEVAKLAEAHPFIQSLPLGYSTKVGERGSSLSGGQRQRIAIARALLANPRILILDEATSSLDTESERRFQENLRRFSRDRTTFIIAHRLSTVRHADSILVLDRGIVVEQGNHDELMAKGGLYYHLAQQQIDL
ncbi:MAG: peptidase domain-containing ABC transporter [Nostocaceae cyanobacterium]|nr:peptidase domain-containing ABC transporter [Nostocaceae cyanobacterium]